MTESERVGDLRRSLREAQSKAVELEKLCGGDNKAWAGLVRQGIENALKRSGSIGFPLNPPPTRRTAA